MIADMIHNKNLNSIVTELFIRDRKLNISLVFITQWYFKVPNDVRLNTTHFFLSQKFQIGESFKKLHETIHPKTETEDFVNICSECTAEAYSFLVNDNPLRFRKIFLEYNKNYDNWWSDKRWKTMIWY